MGVGGVEDYFEGGLVGGFGVFLLILLRALFAQFPPINNLLTLLTRINHTSLTVSIPLILRLHTSTVLSVSTLKSSSKGAR